MAFDGQPSPIVDPKRPLLMRLCLNRNQHLRPHTAAADRAKGLPRCSTSAVLIWLMFCGWVAPPCDAQSTKPSPAPHRFADDPPLHFETRSAVKPETKIASSATDFEADEQQIQAALQWLGDLALRNMPRQYKGDKDWGKTKRVWAGVHMRMDGLKLRTHRRHREVKHGRWIRYEVAVLPPPAAQPKIVIETAARQTDTATDTNRWGIDSTLELPMQFTARVQRWNLGVRAVSMTVTGTMRLNVNVRGTVGFLVDYSEIPPGFAVDPLVQHVDLHLDSFKVQRISDLGGELAQGWGEVIEELLLERLVEKQGDRVKQKINESIEKHRSDLKISMSDWLTQYSP